MRFSNTWKIVSVLAAILGIGGIAAPFYIEHQKNEEMTASNRKACANGYKDFCGIGHNKFVPPETPTRKTASRIELPSREQDLKIRQLGVAAWKKVMFTCHDALANELTIYHNIKGHHVASELGKEASEKLAEYGGMAAYQSAAEEEIHEALNSNRASRNAREWDCIRESNKAEQVVKILRK